MRSLPGPTFPLTTQGREESRSWASTQSWEPPYPPQVSLGSFWGRSCCSCPGQSPGTSSCLTCRLLQCEKMAISGKILKDSSGRLSWIRWLIAKEQERRCAPGTGSWQWLAAAQVRDVCANGAVPLCPGHLHPQQPGFSHTTSLQAMWEGTGGETPWDAPSQQLLTLSSSPRVEAAARSRHTAVFLPCPPCF